jgi:hypothetical protein
MKRFKHGDVVSVKSEHNNSRILCVAIYINVDKNPTFIAGDKNGVYLLRGKWYGNNSLNNKSFGKVEGGPGFYGDKDYVVGKIKNFRHFKFN